MCGIFGYTGNKERDVINTVLSGLKKLEYRGYDSSGIAGLYHGELKYCKEVGKISALEEEIQKANLHLDVAIAHTRWATHGQPSRLNAHPQFDSKHSLALVHNGIIENYISLRDSLRRKGVEFVSNTDTEVIAHLVASLYTGNLLEALQQAIQQLKGAYALALVHVDYPDYIFAVAHESPLAIGLGDQESFLASDSEAFTEYTQEAVFLSNMEIAIVKKGERQFYDLNLNPISKDVIKLKMNAGERSKGMFEHYTLKEIFEQPMAITHAISGRLLVESGTACFEEAGFAELKFEQISNIVILACGSSWHAGCIAAYMIEEYAGVPVKVEISSEFRYKNPVIQSGTLAIAISQSGETADTIAAVREMKVKGAKILALCNVISSTLVRESDVTLFLRAGPEIGVCSTKAFTNQVVLLLMLGLYLARQHRLSKAEGQAFAVALENLPLQVKHLLDQAPTIQEIAKRYAHYENFFFLGRHFMYPTSLEGALKLKEIAYINANGYPAGEMKHGPIALINENCPTFALCSNKATFTKILSNLMEVKARNGLVIAVAAENQDVSSVADEVIRIPISIDPIYPVLASIATQLFAYYVAKERGAEIDQPRNLAKSVTVE